MNVSRGGYLAGVGGKYGDRVEGKDVEDRLLLLGIPFSCSNWKALDQFWRQCRVSSSTSYLKDLGDMDMAWTSYDRNVHD